MKILIVDDHLLTVDSLMHEIKTLLPNALCIGTTRPQKVLQLMESYQFDIVFMDIEMPDTNGIHLVRKILAYKPRTNIIYVTEYDRYALESYSTYASAFLKKPVSTEMIADALAHLRYPVSVITAEMLENAFSGKTIIGKNIQRCREERGMSRKDFAEAMDVASQTIYRWENGERIPDIVTFMKIAKIFGITTDEMMQS